MSETLDVAEVRCVADWKVPMTEFVSAVNEKWVYFMRGQLCLGESAVISMMFRDLIEFLVFGTKRESIEAFHLALKTLYDELEKTGAKLQCSFILNREIDVGFVKYSFLGKQNSGRYSYAVQVREHVFVGHGLSGDMS